MLIDAILETAEFSRFLDAARGFCNFVETETSLTKTDFLLVIQNHLATLYSTARQIPLIKIKYDKDVDSEISKEAVNSIIEAIGDRVPFCYYRIVLNPFNMSNSVETGTGDLTDDLSNIYKDLKESLLIFDTDDIAAKEHAVWKFRFEFDSHWSKHCIDGLSAIHHYLTENK